LEKRTAAGEQILNRLEFKLQLVHKSQAEAVTIQPEFNAKAQRRQDAKLTQQNPNNGGWATFAHQMVTPKTASKGFQNLCAFASWRLKNSGIGSGLRLNESVFICVHPWFIFFYCMVTAEA
jgi:hypothetical protein